MYTTATRCLSNPESPYMRTHVAPVRDDRLVMRVLALIPIDRSSQWREIKRRGRANMREHGLRSVLYVVLSSRVNGVFVRSGCGWLAGFGESEKYNKGINK